VDRLETIMQVGLYAMKQFSEEMSAYHAQKTALEAANKTMNSLEAMLSENQTETAKWKKIAYELQGVVEGMGKKVELPKAAVDRPETVGSPQATPFSGLPAQGHGPGLKLPRARTIILALMGIVGVATAAYGFFQTLPPIPTPAMIQNEAVERALGIIIMGLTIPIWWFTRKKKPKTTEQETENAGPS
jgi:hypothetical protein